MEDQQIRETVRKSIPCLYYGKSGDILQEENEPQPVRLPNVNAATVNNVIIFFTLIICLSFPARIF